jgi:hypothetical protein
MLSVLLCSNILLQIADLLLLVICRGKFLDTIEPCTCRIERCWCEARYEREKCESFKVSDEMGPNKPIQQRGNKQGSSCSLILFWAINSRE